MAFNLLIKLISSQTDISTIKTTMDARKMKEAVKAAIAFVIAYGIALQYNWMNPYWAGFAVSMVAFPGFNTGMSLRKAMFRLAGTIPGSIMGLIISGVAGQDRWLFIILVAGWLILTTFMMLADKRHAYFYNVMGFTMVMVILADPSSSSDAFNHSLYRSIDNVLGIMSYTLVSFLIWPIRNAKSPKELSVKIIDEQKSLIVKLINNIKGISSVKPIEAKELIADVSDLQEVIDVASYEDENVKMIKEKWDSLYETSLLTVRSINRIVVSFNNLGTTNIDKVIVNAVDVLEQINHRFDLIEHYILDKKPLQLFETIRLELDKEYLNKLDVTDKSRISLILHELRTLEKHTKELFEVLNGKEHQLIEQQEKVLHNRLKDAIYDVNLWKRALLPGLATLLGYCAWIFFNPPGGAMWFTLPGPSAMAIAATPQMNSRAMVKGLALFSFVVLIVYVFVFPAISTFFWLGLILFALVFAVRYFLEGIVYLTASLGIMGMGIQNPMQYDFAHMLSNDFANVFATVLVIVAAYMLQNSRPEKAFMQQVKSFFKSCAFVIENQSKSDNQKSILERLKYKIAVRNIMSLPLSIEDWSKSISNQIVDPERIHLLVIGIQKISMQLSLSIEESVDEFGDVKLLEDEFSKWRTELVHLVKEFEHFSSEDEKSLEITFKNKYRNVIDVINNNTIEQVEFYPMIASYLMLSKSLIEYSDYANGINWTLLKEERFS